jgi:hypothetical protein
MVQYKGLIELHPEGRLVALPTTMEGAESYKHTSLLWYELNYGSKNILLCTPWPNVIKLFTSKIYEYL